MAKIRTTHLKQIGIMVKDLEKSVAAYEKFLGRKADYVGITWEYEKTLQELRGEPSYGRCYQAIFNLDNVQLELISPYGEGESVWKECLESDGEGLHHLAFKTDDMQGAVEEVKRRSGAELVQYGTWPDEPTRAEYTYMDCRGELKTFVELLKFNEGENWDEIEGIES